jgi:L-amino acid N-acyltransferase YncA
MSVSRIYFSRSASCTPATAIIYEATNELIQSGDVESWGLDFPVKPTDSIFYSVATDGDINGVLCFRVDHNTRSVTVVLFYVELSSRRQGVFGSLWSELMEYVREEALLRIYAAVTPTNNIAEDILGRLGASSVSTRFQLEV